MSYIKAPAWFTDFVNKEFKPAINGIHQRIDNLVKVNKLKEK